ncbi:MAG: patatin-like phospholipase family protein [Bacteroidota bacterium]
MNSLNNSVYAPGAIRSLKKRIYQGRNGATVKSPKPYRILSIDGGGIRGIIPATILWCLEQKLQQKTKNPAARLSDYFDFMTGTSTGGILVCIYLAPDELNPQRSARTAREALDLYLSDGKHIFNQSLGRKISSADGLLGQKYCGENLEIYLKKAIGGDVKMSELVKPCLIPTYDLQQQEALFMGKQAALSRPAYDLPAWQVARSTSAAPTFFEPASVDIAGKEVLLADGGLFAKNPAMHGYLHAKTNIAREQDTLVVSIGTGDCKAERSYQTLRRKGAMAWLKPLIQIMNTTGADLVNDQMEQLFANTENQYVRLDPCLHQADRAMDNASQENMQALYEAGLHYIEQNSVQLDHLVNQLVR